MKKLLLPLVALLALTGAASAGVTRSDRDNGFPSFRWCHEDFIQFQGSGNGQSSQADFSNFSTTATLAASVPVAVGNGQLAAGALQLSLQAVGDASIRIHPNSFQLGTDQFEFIFVGREVTVSAAGEVYTQRIGFFDDDATPADGVYFRYTHGTNAGEWEAVAIATGGGAETVVDTNVVFTAGTARTFRIRVDATAANAYFYIGGTLVATISTAADIPNGTEYTGAGVSANKTTHTAATVISMAVDYMAVKVTYTTPRC